MPASVDAARGRAHVASLTGMFSRPRVPTITVDEVADDSVIVDVRDGDEFRAGRIEGAQHIELMELPGRIADVPADRPVVVVCRVGGRSAQATAFLVQSGIDAVNLDGGMVAWAASGRPMVGDVEQPFVL